MTRGREQMNLSRNNLAYNTINQYFELLHVGMRNRIKSVSPNIQSGTCPPYIIIRLPPEQDQLIWTGLELKGTMAYKLVWGLFKIRLVQNPHHPLWKIPKFAHCEWATLRGIVSTLQVISDSLKTSELMSRIDQVVLTICRRNPLCKPILLSEVSWGKDW